MNMSSNEVHVKINEVHVNIDQIIEYILGPKSEMVYYRGVSNSRYDLIPSLFREDNEELIHNIAKRYMLKAMNTEDFVDIDLKQCEFYILKEFHDMANKQGIAVPPIPVCHQHFAMDLTELIRLGDFSPFMEIASLAQHYGLPTRMLDWTTDFLTALYFACNKYEEDCKRVSVAIYMFHADNIINKSVRTIFPDYSLNPNIRAQSGLFTVYTRYEDSSKSFTEQLRLGDSIIINGSKPCITKWIISSSIIPDCLDLLKVFGYTHSRMFPGLSGIAKEIMDDRPLHSKYYE